MYTGFERYSLIGMGLGIADISSMGISSAEHKYSLIWMNSGKANKSFNVDLGNWKSLAETP